VIFDGVVPEIGRKLWSFTKPTVAIAGDLGDDEVTAGDRPRPMSAAIFSPRASEDHRCGCSAEPESSGTPWLTALLLFAGLASRRRR
jgi:MYXO-CTERM domain-containing protein